ncbi:hypothetical protein NERG_01094 [Nematocida ausubeli]|uniref:Uncharacterized protein n=1 Tax=Nematocida ausubeli (strain ATCC PRA-371 / ERTm2) TaxID=1913371 RepID=H8ZCU7_NEMA1|nr:hypothetical protein NERG_01094 [Nematocida ausubeli]
MNKIEKEVVLEMKCLSDTEIELENNDTLSDTDIVQFVIPDSRRSNFNSIEHNKTIDRFDCKEEGWVYTILKGINSVFLYCTVWMQGWIPLFLVFTSTIYMTDSFSGSEYRIQFFSFLSGLLFFTFVQIICSSTIKSRSSMSVNGFYYFQIIEYAKITAFMAYLIVFFHMLHMISNERQPQSYSDNVTFERVLKIIWHALSLVFIMGLYNILYLTLSFLSQYKITRNSFKKIYSNGTSISTYIYTFVPVTLCVLFWFSGFIWYAHIFANLEVPILNLRSYNAADRIRFEWPF